ncbi:hypothetical protein EZV62_024110 [Acer yangbiense]|uniref:Reverse transcriptase zinc-binding domain-containing protein n=1 Tax=Acer yangbiense TaxID=1000413 RepID=A0A5C7H5S9_9ROSI|nr:hypothetical protein EZV62_024110 [Acer yangbiense]
MWRRPSWGVHQGDPSSPLLFCLAEEAFSHSLSDLFHNGLLKPITALKGCFPPIQLLYVYDIFIFYRVDSRSLNTLKDFFDSYGVASSQLVSSDKSSYFRGQYSFARKAIMESMIGFKEGTFPFVYLGVLLFYGSSRGVYFQPLLDRVKVRFAGWKGHLLSMAGRAQLIQSVIQSMLLHCFRIYKIPSSILLNLRRCCYNFLWSGNVETFKLVTVPLDNSAWSIYFRCNFLRKYHVGSPMKSSIVSLVRDCFPSISRYSRWLIGDGSLINLWKDKWLDHSILSLVNYHELYDFVRGFKSKVTWSKIIWRRFIPSKNSFLFLRLLHGKLPTDDNLLKIGFCAPSACLISLRNEETIHHLFCGCSFAT